MRQVATIILIFLAGLSGFILGRLSVSGTHYDAPRALPIVYQSAGLGCAAQRLGEHWIRWTCRIEEN